MEFIKLNKKDSLRWVRNVCTPILLLFLTSSATAGAQGSIDFRAAIQDALTNKNVPMDQWGCLDLQTPDILAAASGEYQLPDGSILSLRNTVGPSLNEPEPGFTTREGTVQSKDGTRRATLGAFSQHGGPETTKFCPTGN